MIHIVPDWSRFVTRDAITFILLLTPNLTSSLALFLLLQILCIYIYIYICLQKTWKHLHNRYSISANIHLIFYVIYIFYVYIYGSTENLEAFTQSIFHFRQYSFDILFYLYRFLCIYINIFLCVFIYIYIYIGLQKTWKHLRNRYSISANIHLIFYFIYIDFYVYIYKYIFMCVCVCVYIYIYGCIYIYIYMGLQKTWKHLRNRYSISANIHLIFSQGIKLLD